MKIYKIARQKHSYESYSGHVIVANNEAEVVALAQEISAFEGGEVWLTATIEQCGDYTGTEIKPFILLSDYIAG